VLSQQRTFLRVLPTRWRRKQAGMDTERNYVLVTLYIRTALRLTINSRNVSVPLVLCFCRLRICQGRWRRLAVRWDDSEIRLSDKNILTHAEWFGFVIFIITNVTDSNTFCTLQEIIRPQLPNVSYQNLKSELKQSMQLNLNNLLQYQALLSCKITWKYATDIKFSWLV